MLFRSVDTLSQKAGVPKALLRRLVLKELVDNALDSGALAVQVSALSADTYVIEDNGSGISGDDAAVARLFSLNRPLVSSKLWRKPSRGAMGNGLRVVVGAVAASDGALTVETRGRRLTLRSVEDGSTAVVLAEPTDLARGTTVEITFGASLPVDQGSTLWADAAIGMAFGGTTYTGKPSPYWYDADAFFELLRAAGPRPVREMIEQLDGCSGSRAGRIASAFRATGCNALTREEAYALLHAARVEAKPVRPERLGTVGALDTLPAAYSCQRGTVTIGGREPKAEIPFAVEAWAETSSRPLGGQRSKASLQVFVNRTPIAAEVRAYMDKSDFEMWGCGLGHSVAVGSGGFRVTINLNTPWCPITTDGKEPDLSYFVVEILAAVRKACRRAKSAAVKPTDGREGLTHKSVVLRNLDIGIAKAGGDGEYRFNQRQLFYVMRPIVLAELGAELLWPNFCGIVTDHENEAGEIPGMYRDPRGTLYHPHLGQDITLGTLAVESYERPPWTFGQVLYIEKEGFFEALKSARWPERHDCALLTSKGFSTRAVRDLIDLLGEGDEPVSVFCVHDADAFGTMIFETLQEETRARARRSVEIINLGLDPWEAIDMGLAPEGVKDVSRRKAVAGYVQARDDGEQWVEWLQDTRVELNEMTTPQFIAWLDAKMAEHGTEKVVPPRPVIAAEAEARLTSHIRKLTVKRILREADLDGQVAAQVAAIDMPSPTELEAEVEVWLDQNEAGAWPGGVERVVVDLASGRGASS